MYPSVYLLIFFLPINTFADMPSDFPYCISLKKKNNIFLIMYEGEPNSNGSLNVTW